MKPTSITLLLLANLICESLSGINLYYANTTYHGTTYVDESCAGKVVEINSENPKSLNIFDFDCQLDAPYSSIMTSPNAWKECYLIKKSSQLSVRSGIMRVGKVGVVELYKDINSGVIKVVFYDNTNRRHLFRPKDGECIDVRHMPSVFFNKVQIANVRADGGVINDYGRFMNRDSIDCLKINAVYQVNSNNKDIDLHFKVVNKNGVEIKDPKMSANCSATIHADSSERSIVVSMQLSKHELKLLEKWCRIEIYVGKDKLCSKEIPIHAQIVYLPVSVVRVRTSNGNEIQTVPFNPGNSSLGQPMMTKQHVISSGEDLYRVLEWMEIEI